MADGMAKSSRGSCDAFALDFAASALFRSYEQKRWRDMRAMIFGLAVILAAAPAAASEKAHLSRVVHSAFQCVGYAFSAGNEAEGQRLFTVGVTKGREFLSALRSKEITPEDFQKSVPAGISMLIQGPSDDFILGRIYQSVSIDALTEVREQDDQGQPLKVPLIDDAKRKVVAQGRYERANCDKVR